ncbi:MmgE/PrpD family protein [Bradyrhizobium tropiciagri]|uniref:MmgE/PrpD family protein n=1 Tax=Bradyrhizobium tropiciagri TaxID=312253 RepID=UPI00067C2563|nr:MmgE/PrpD family protein [Bradyrhizobium tropiciagri]
MASLTRSLGEFVAGLVQDRVPDDILAKARTCLFYNLGVARGSNMTPYAASARNASIALHGLDANGATMLGDGRKTALLGAVFANAALFHGRTQDDTCGAAHIGAMVIPALVALAEVKRWPLAHFLPALIAGYEVGGLLEAVGSAGSTVEGFRASPLYGSMAVAAASAHFMQLPAAKVDAAIANAASVTGGLLQPIEDGTEEWRFQLGFAAVNGVMAASLTAQGNLTSPLALEGSRGLFQVFTKRGIDSSHVAARLGQDWALRRVTFKPFPVCAFNQTPISAALRLREMIAGRNVDRVEVRMNPYETGYAGMDARGPFTTIAGTLMSVPFCVSHALLRGAPTIHSMLEFDDAAVNALASRIELQGDPSVGRLSCAIVLELEDGAVLRDEMARTPNDYDFSAAQVEELVRSMGEEANVRQAAYDSIAAFARELPHGDIESMLKAFSN